MNRLQHATSPYLRQHADNPVDWYEWGSEALKRARAEGRPILLSIGYSACHWCHVMAHESFEDDDTAALMNRLFVNIKVDREERPDLDKIYQTAHHLLARRAGGWPLTVFLSPDDHLPFFAGTYFPSESRHGLPSFRDLMLNIDEIWRERRGDIERQNRSVQAALDAIALGAEPLAGAPNAGPMDANRRALESSFDARHGGFGRAPKFPHPMSIDSLLRFHAHTRDRGEADRKSLAMALTTLVRMAEGGMNDQIGGGFCRYSVDDLWMIPHFEKMLYDNGLLLALYADAWALTREPLFERTVRATIGWMLTEMQGPDGAFHSALDADSEGEEGRFYVWSRAELAQLLGDDFALVAARFGFDRDANFEGHWHAHVFTSLDSLAQRFGLTVQDVQSRIDSACERLLEARAARVRPGLDDKILTAWNALAIRGLARAARVFGEREWIDAASAALEFLHARMWRDGRLYATAKDGEVRLPAYLDDHAFLLDAVLELLQVRWRDDWLTFAIALAETLIARFEDPASGGFFFTAHDHEQLIQRPKPFTDDATPAGNGVAAFALARLGHLVGDQRFTDAAERAIRAGWEGMEQTPHAHNALLNALEELLYPPTLCVIRGAQAAMLPWLHHAFEGYHPRRLAFAIPDDAADLPELIVARTPRDEVTAYVCTGRACLAPVDSLSDFVEQLRPAAKRQ
ncbi:MAG: thioredoxin domain-containing protein [Chromatiales bacterium]|nr:thioredoxin domain-containing protein [Chromatiales bacterium]